MRSALRFAIAALGLAILAAACGGDDGGGGTGIFGTWRASQQDPGTELVFDDNAGTTFDVITDGPAPGVATLLVNTNGSFTLTITVGGFVVDTRSGTYVADTSAHTITITETGTMTPIPFDYILLADTLSIATQNFGDIVFDFDNDPMTPDDPADLFGTFIRR
jgi:hypothetical protein